MTAENLSSPRIPAWQADQPVEELLGPGMNAESLRVAVERSGYPLQTVAADALARRDFHVEEEWAYEDVESKKRRAIDVLGEFSAGDFVVSDVARTTILLALLGECKQSKHPYVAFEAVAPPRLDRYPAIVGLGRREIELHPDDSDLNWFLPTPLALVLDLTREPLVACPPTATTISRGVARGKDFELSGDEPYNALVMPLVKATQRYSEYWSAKWDDRDYTAIARLTLPVAIVDAPLLLVRGGPGSSELIPANWIRVISHRAVSGQRDPWQAKAFDVVDVVHASFLERFVDNYAVPYARSHYERLGAIHDVLVAGKATVRGWTERPLPEDLFERLMPGAPP